ncbi:BspA family leucine-rich repeat surface protein [Flavobacteriaceae bacterium]|nr:BspA family leucine-rich repeat surface protein [Flavobacteriaceae bacterium]
MKSILRSTILISFLFLFINSCSKDSPIPDAVVPTPETSVTKFTLVVAASEGGSVDISGGTYNENSNVTVTAAPAEGYAFSGWSGDASGSTNPLSVSITGNKDITASFIRLQYSLSVNITGSGTVSQVLVESSEKNTDYDSFSTVRLTAQPESNWVFYGWSGSTTETTSEVDLLMEGTKSVTATFEERLNQIIGVNDVFFGNGKWKIRKPKESSGSGQGEASRQAQASCALSEIIFRTDGSFTIVTGTTTVTGQFIIDSNTTISLTQAQSPFGTITNLVISNNFISFSLSLASGCDDTIEGERDEDYNEDTDTSLPPVISLVGSSTINLQVGDTFTDPGATASDNIDGDLTSTITSSGTVDTASEGTYTIYYNVSDAAGNIASVSRTVIVSLDLPPIITLTGSATISILVGDTYIENGCVATDALDGDLTSSIITSGTVDTSTVGTYTLVYSVSDSASNIVSTTRTVIVNSPLDTTPPSITLTGASIISVAVGTNWTDPGATATDDVDGDLTSSITTSGAINTSNTGTFTISYSVSDAAGNTASVNRTVVVLIDSIAPVITLTGSSTISVVVGATFTDPGATASDNIDGDLTSSITTSGTVNTSNTGTFTISYGVSDAAGNAATVVQRTVIVSVALSISFVNGTCECPNAIVGDTAVIGGVTYTAVDNSTIAGEIANNNVNLCTTLVTSMAGDINAMSNFFNDNSFNSDISFWDTSNVNDMQLMFTGASTFNQNIGGWDTSSVSSTLGMFYNASSFNQNIGDWDTSSVVDMSFMFYGANEFNQYIGNWDTSSVTNMEGVFSNASAFNQNIGGWDTSSVNNMAFMFEVASVFNQNIGSWNTSSVTDMTEMFKSAIAFNQNIGGWDTSNVYVLGGIFYGATAFNQDIGSWDVTGLQSNPTEVFYEASSFNQDLTGWCVSSYPFEPSDFATNSALTDANKPLWGKKFTIALTTGSNSQTVTATNAITDIVYTATPICAGSISASASGLPSGVTLAFGNNVATISGSANATGTFNYTVTFTGSSTTQAVTGTITVNAAAVASSISFVNGTCECPNATVGDTAVINGVTYTAVDNSTIAGQIANGNVNLCTTLVTSMSNLFKDNTSFNSDIGFWDTSNVTSMYDMFNAAIVFNQDIGNWNTSSVTSIYQMFTNASAFNQDISGWNTAAVTSMMQMFNRATAFNGDISSWNTSSVTNMGRMFQETAFNQNIGAWDTSNVTDMSGMFLETPFNQNIGNWDTRNVTNMRSMFEGASAFNQDIGSWNTSIVTDMGTMFQRASSFNQDIGSWNTSSVNYILSMFNAATTFNQNLTGWCVSSYSLEPNFFATNSALTNANKPLWGKEFTVALTTGSNSQTVTATNAITDIVYTATPICAGSISASASGLPSGVTLAFGNNVATISGSANATGTFNYTVTLSGATTSQSVSGTITVNASSTTSSSVSSSISLTNSRGLTIDSNDNIYISEYNGSIKKISTNNSISNYAGADQTGDATGNLSNARFTNPIALDFDSNGNLFVSDHNNDKIKKISNSTVTVFATIDSPNGIYIDSSDNLYVCEQGDHKIKKIASDGTVTVLAGSTVGYLDGIGSNAKINSPNSIVMDSNGMLFFTSMFAVKKLDPSTGEVTTFAGLNDDQNSGADDDVDGVGTLARFGFLKGITIDSNDNLYVSDSGNNKIKKIAPDGTVSSIAGSTNGLQDGNGSSAKFSTLYHIDIDSNGNLYVNDYNNGKIRKITPSGDVTTL